MTILAIDVGNTNIKLALYYTGQLLHSFSAVTKKERTDDELGMMITDFLAHREFAASDITNVIVCSVVPTLNDMLELACQKYLHTKPTFVGGSALKIPLNIKIDEPSCLGADRIATSVGAISRYGSNLIVFNFGTATVTEVIGEDSDYLGGTIAPGITASISALHTKASLLPLYKFSKPSKAIATSTQDALYGGIFYGTIGLIERIVQEIKLERPRDYKIIATGGLARFVQENTDTIQFYDDDLTTFGLYQINLLNQSN